MQNYKMLLINKEGNLTERGEENLASVTALVGLGCLVYFEIPHGKDRPDVKKIEEVNAMAIAVEAVKTAGGRELKLGRGRSSRDLESLPPAGDKPNAVRGRSLSLNELLDWSAAYARETRARIMKELAEERRKKRRKKGGKKA